MAQVYREPLTSGHPDYYERVYKPEKKSIVQNVASFLHSTPPELPDVSFILETKIGTSGEVISILKGLSVNAFSFNKLITLYEKPDGTKQYNVTYKKQKSGA